MGNDQKNYHLKEIRACLICGLVLSFMVMMLFVADLLATIDAVNAVNAELSAEPIATRRAIDGGVIAISLIVTIVLIVATICVGGEISDSRRGEKL